MERFRKFGPAAASGYFYYYAYLAAFLAYVLFALASQPIIKGDTDLWYHLNGGRYIVEHGEIADSSFFSFIEPPRQRANYYWLFQWLSYRIYQVSGYGGLIALRTALFLFIAVILWGLFRVRLKGVTPYFAALFALYIMILLPRCLLSRPHAFSYLFMAVFVYVYEIRPGRSYVLPLVAILWVNLHGIEYPVMLLISGAYMCDAYIGRLKRHSSFTREELTVIVSSAACIGAVYLNPRGAALLQVPFTDTRYASVYINELRRLSAGEFFSFTFGMEGISYESLFNVVVVSTIIAVTASLIYKKPRLSHILMLIGGIVLLTKGARFRSEFAILALPVIVGGLPFIYNNADGAGAKGVFPARLWRTAAAIALLPLPFIFIHGVVKESPVLARELPHGVVSFLKHIGRPVGEGVDTLMNHPNSGGYLQWELYPRYKIAIDMEVPFLFSDFDFYNVLMAYQDEAVLRRFIARYRPSFITVPLQQYTAFKGIIAKFPEYKPVFFDDAEALYSRNPEVVRLYSIKAIDPFAVEIPAKDKAAAVLLELNKISSIDPRIDSVNQVIAHIKINEGSYAEAAGYAERFIESSPGLPGGYYLKGDALMGKQSYALALKYFTIALSKARDDKKPLIYRKLWECLFKMKRDKEAYEALSKAVDVFSPQTPYSDLYMLGLLALGSGDGNRAQMLFKSAYEKLPLPDNGTSGPSTANDSSLPDNSSPVEWERKIKKMLSAF